MTTLRWDPWGELAALQRDLDQLFGRRAGRGAEDRPAVLAPPMDAYRTDDGLVVRIDLPGLHSDAVDVSVQDGVLTIQGDRPEEEIPQDRWLRRERPTGRFERSFTLPERANPEDITARFEQGLLELRIPHPPARQARRIQVGRTRDTREAIDVSARAAETGS
jgi:HSP20 family protein